MTKGNQPGILIEGDDVESSVESLRLVPGSGNGDSLP